MASPVSECIECKTSVEIYHCHGCGELYCSNCQVRHLRGRHADKGIPYEVYQQVEVVLATEEDELLRAQMHYSDSLARWIGIDMPCDTGKAQPSLCGYSRITGLLVNNGTSEIQYPSLVSFIGRTGSGKSTLIRSLVRYSCQDTPTPGMEPIISSHMTAHRSTSSDVHLYSDPGTNLEKHPLLLADSEGLGGGPPESQLGSFGSDGVSEAVMAPRATVTNRRSIAWALNEKADRMYIVGHLYPRFLYTFSDLICFVASTAREIERDAVDLLEWASLGYEKTLNQRTPPALIVVINNAVDLVDGSWYDVSNATQKWLTRLDESVNSAHKRTFSKYEELKAKWSYWGTNILKPSQLLLRYYSDFKVVCVPSSLAKLQTYNDIHSQYHKLHHEIRTLALLTAEKKKTANLILDTTTFQMYIHQALNHFAKEHKKPFDLEKILGNMRPAPRKFKDHVVNILLHMRDKLEIDEERKLLEQIAPLVAAAVAFSASQIGEDRDVQTYFDQVFARHCIDAYEKFYQEHWRCEQTLNGKRCKNVSGGHVKGHQYVYNPNEDNGIWISNGEFTALYDPSLFTKLVVGHLRPLTRYDPEIHKQMLQQPVLKDWLCKVRTNRTCLACLSNHPEHLLTCRHVLCNTCVASFSVSSGGNNRYSASVCIPKCPLGCASHGPGWPWKSFMKPPSAGVRVLSLDGGGIRGILELVVLEYLQGYVAAELGAEVSIITMFDLVVGTSAGGIIALGLAHCLWNVRDSIDKFTDLASKMFSLRPLSARPIFRYLYSHKYRSSVVEDMYKQLFSETELLISGRTASPIRVAVTAVSDITGSYKPYLMANYSRPFIHENEWLLRPETYDQELKVWEAARATTAAPTFFKPYMHSATGVAYKDGALKCNNPIRIADSERRSIWRSGNNSLDLHLSIGSGVDPKHFTKSPVNFDRRAKDVVPLSESRRSKTGLEVLIDIATDAVKSTMDSESEYESFRQDLHNQETRKRYHRFNVRINDGQPTPSMDDYKHIQRLKALAKKYCESKDIGLQLREVARMLVSSSFYFEKKGWLRLSGNWVCQGNVHSRFSAGQPEVLSVFLAKNLSFMVRAETPPNAGGEPEFETVSIVQAVVTPWPMPLEFTVSEASKDRRISIDVMFPEDFHCPISGFPRTIV